MYAALWRKLPGNVWAKITLLVFLVSVICWLLLYVVFPWIGPVLAGGDAQVV